MIAERIRNFFDSLFPHRSVLLLRRSLEQEKSEHRAEIERIAMLYENRCRTLAAGITQREAQTAEAQKERDYFRGRAERLELRLLPDPVPRNVPRGTQEPVGRKNWKQVQQDHAEKLAKEAEQAKAAKEQHGLPSERRN